MTNDLRRLLAELREAAKTEREKGTYFERLAVAFIKHDPGMAQEYEDAWLYADWAKDQGIQAKDLGIDAVAKLRSGGFCAIQCKFYAESHKLRAEDLNGFLAASSTGQFERRLFIDTTNQPLSENLEHLLVTQQVPTTRIGLDRLDESPVDWAAFLLRGEIKVGAKKEPLPHQLEALRCTDEGFAEHDRGKLIMACGTGKTFTALTIAQELVGPGKSVLFLVPSLSLMSQSVREWTIDAKVPLRSFAVCSDAQVGKRRRQSDDVAEIEVHDLDYPATTNAAKLAAKASAPSPDRMTVVFATYQSIQVISEAQKQHGLPEFDLIICDEAHRTTGATFPGEDQSNFVRVHDQEYLRGKKRLYMTATPRVFGEVVKAKANEASVELSSMDNEALYGPTFFARGFGWAVEQGLLTDYKVIVLAVDEEMVSASIQSRLADAESELMRSCAKGWSTACRHMPWPVMRPRRWLTDEIERSSGRSKGWRLGSSRYKRSRLHFSAASRGFLDEASLPAQRRCGSRAKYGMAYERFLVPHDAEDWGAHLIRKGIGRWEAYEGDDLALVFRRHCDAAQAKLCFEGDVESVPNATTGEMALMVPADICTQELLDQIEDLGIEFHAFDTIIIDAEDSDMDTIGAALNEFRQEHLAARA